MLARVRRGALPPLVGHRWRQAWEALRDAARYGARGALLPPPTLLWLGFGCLALVESNDLPNHVALPRVTDPLVASLVLAALLLAFALFGLAVWAASRGVGERPARAAGARAWPPLAQVARWLWYPLLLWLLLTSALSVVASARTLVTIGTHAPPIYTSDDLYDNQYNALLTLRGVNPYVGDHLAASLAHFGTDGYTPLERGRFSDPFSPPTTAQIRAVLAEYRAHPSTPPPEVSPLTTHSYPAGSFLVDVPFVWAGLPSMVPVQCVLLLALALGLLALAPAPWRLVLALLLLGNSAALARVLTGDFDIWWIAALVAAWWCGSARMRSAALVGVACAIKQLAWFLAPFYVVWVWRARGPREALGRGLIALATFLLINLPWMVMSSRAWLSSLFLPMSLPLLPEGVGLTGLAFAHLLPLFPRLVYTLLEATVGLGLLALYWRVCPRAPTLGLFVGLLPLVMAWRADERYFLPLSLLAVAAVVLAARSLRRTSAASDLARAPAPREGPEPEAMPSARAPR